MKVKRRTKRSERRDGRSRVGGQSRDSSKSSSSGGELRSKKRNSQPSSRTEGGEERRGTHGGGQLGEDIEAPKDRKPSRNIGLGGDGGEKRILKRKSISASRG